MQNLSHRASFHAGGLIAPANPGIKHLAECCNPLDGEVVGGDEEVESIQVILADLEKEQAPAYQVAGSSSLRAKKAFDVAGLTRFMPTEFRAEL